MPLARRAARRSTRVESRSVIVFSDDRAARLYSSSLIVHRSVNVPPDRRQ